MTDAIVAEEFYDEFYWDDYGVDAPTAATVRYWRYTTAGGKEYLQAALTFAAAVHDFTATSLGSGGFSFTLASLPTGFQGRRVHREARATGPLASYPVQPWDGYATASDEDDSIAEHDATQADIAGLNDPTATAIADAVWDELITGVEHNVPASAARFLREAAQNLLIRDGMAQGATATTITLDANASSVTDFYKRDRIVVSDGTGVGQSRIITAYDGTTKVATIDRPWLVAPDATSNFLISAADAHLAAMLHEDSRVQVVEELGAQAKADVNAEADTALADYDPPTRTEATSDKAEILAQLANGTYGLAALNTDLDSILSRLGLTTDTGGTTSAGTAQAKMNAILALAIEIEDEVVAPSESYSGDFGG